MPQNESESGSSTSLISIIMDDREPRDLMTQALASCRCFTVEVQYLPRGDHLIDDSLLGERKILADLLRSIYRQSTASTIPATWTL